MTPPVTTLPTPGTPVGPLGFVERASAPGTATWEYDVKPEHFNPNGTITVG